MRLLIVRANLGDLKTIHMLGRPKLETLQRAVGGYIEPVYLAELIDDNIIMLCNEEGVINSLPINDNLYPYFFCGDVVFVARKGEDFVGLNAEQYERVTEWLKG